MNLTARAALALESATKNSGDNKTDTVNRALQVYAYLVQELGGDAAQYAVALVECWRERSGGEEGRV